MYKKTATDALNEYIDHFEGRSRSKHYTRRVSDLLSPKPKFKYLDAGEKLLDSKMSTNSGKLLSWINESYQDSLKSTCAPLYAQQDQAYTVSSLPKSSKSIFEESISPAKYREVPYQMVRDLQDDLSSLPSPRISEVDIDSDQGTVETDILVSSYKGNQEGLANSSWIKNKTSESSYPRWVDEVNHSTASRGDPRRLSSVSVLLKTSPSHSILSKTRTMDTTGLTMDDTRSIDTEIALDTSIYGNQPVNMGGDLHRPLFRDDRVEAILNESRKKLKKQRDKFVGRSIHSLSNSAEHRKSDYTMSPESRDVKYTKRIMNQNRNSYEIDLNRENSKREPRGYVGSSRSRTTGNNDRIHFNAAKSSTALYMDTSKQNHFLSSSSSKGTVSKDTRRPQLQSSSSASTKVRSFSKNYVAERLSAVGNPARPNNQFLNTSVSLKDNEVASQRTSGYHSDIFSPSSNQTAHYTFSSNKQFSPRTSSPERTSSPVKSSATSFIDRRAFARKDSNSTDILLRRPPSGTKVHQRSKTWSSRSFGVQVPNAESTPKQSLHYRSLNKSTQYLLDGHNSEPSITVSGSAPLRVPPSSSPHSAPAARTFAEQRSPYFNSQQHSDNSRENGFSYKHIATRPAKPVDSYTNWKSSALGSARSKQLIVREEVISKEQDVISGSEEEFVQKRYAPPYFSTEVDKIRPSKSFVDDKKNDDSFDQHNRTWPSLQKFKETQSTRLNWTESKRSIPLRPSNANSQQSSPYSNRMNSSRHHFSQLSISNNIQNPNSIRNTSLSARSSSRVPDESARLTNSQFSARDDRYDSDDDNATVDTELLLSQPPMPIVDASPSLSTVSDGGSTVKDSDESDESSQTFADLPARSSSRVSFAPDVSFSRMNGVSPLSKFESTNPRTADFNLIKDSIYKAVEDANQTQTFSRTVHSESKPMRSELLDSFIDDCMRTSNEESFKYRSQFSAKRSSNADRDEPRTVESLKHLLLNLNDISANEEKIAETESNRDTDEESGNTSDDAASVVGEQSLARAYHHLERLKSLISGKVPAKRDTTSPVI